MSRLGKSELVYGELLTIEEILAKISAVTLEDVRAVAAEVLAAKPTLAVIGPFDNEKQFALTA
jgi:predicted Zn-dependent peptidase